MNPAEIIFGSLLVIVLLGLAGYFGWRQKKTLEKLRRQEMSREDRLYIHKQVQRRLLCCVLMGVLACMLVGWFFLEGHLRSEVAAIQDAGGPPADDADRRESVRLFTFYWIGFLLVLLFILFLAAADLLATARFGFRHRRQLEAERKAMLESQASRIRRERNGQH